MMQPFVKFEKIHLQKVIELGNKYLVSQSYGRVDHFMDQGHIYILLTDYNDLGLAHIHHKAVRTDRFGAIIHLDKPAHLLKINEMLNGNEYALYWSVVPSTADLKKRLHTSYKNKIRKYLMQKTSWQVGKDEQVRSQMQVIFGELFLILKWRNQRLRIKFAEIERF